MTDLSEQEVAFFELVNTYPSPHNGQPMIVKKQNDSYEVLFDTERGLKATPISYLFSFVTIGVFFRHIEYCAAALGHEIVSTLALPAQQSMAERTTQLHCGHFVVHWNSQSVDAPLEQALRFRQTSRKKYSKGIDEAAKADLQQLSSGGRVLRFVTPEVASQVIWLNQRAVFDDMFDDPVRGELAHWLRTSYQEKVTKKDGLAYDCMELNGGVLRFILRQYKILRWPIIAPLLQNYYLRTMKDNSTVGYVCSPFTTEQQAYDIGTLVSDIWMRLSKRGFYLHPFGTIVSNTAAHKDFVQLAGENHESRDISYVAFIFRAGASDIPVRSERLGISHMLQ